MPLTQIQDAPVARNIHVVCPPQGTLIEDMLKSEYWAHVARQLHISDRIEAVPEDGAFFAEFYVADVGVNRASVVLLRMVNLHGEELPVLATDYCIKWKGQNLKHTIIRISDQANVKEGFASKPDAETWLREYEKGQNK